ncbi:hypothetical protein AKO1_001404 [Acrasis kona]|uniref:Uncharacterized protein n=1 Tax=Acrasis kona TaxID=1008807 RepID=A0AAW2ZD25_9EUKA
MSTTQHTNTSTSSSGSTSPNEELQNFEYLNISQTNNIHKRSGTCNTNQDVTQQNIQTQPIWNNQAVVTNSSPNNLQNNQTSSVASSITVGVHSETSHSAQENQSDMEDDTFEYNDELNFLINRFDIKEKKPNFMPYIY